MHRVDAPNHNANQFRDKDATLGIAGTKLQSKWHNAVQEELAGVVEAAGIALDDGNNSQLLSALRILFAGQLPSPTIANNVADALNDLDIGAGTVIDSAGSTVIEVGALTKRLDAAWAAGTNQGGRAAGVNLVNGTWYHVFAIAKPDGTSDVVFDTSAVAANRDAAYTKYAWLWSIYYVDGVTGIRPFLQRGDQNIWKSPVQDRALTNIPDTAETTRLSVPPDMVSEALVTIGYEELANAADSRRYLIVSNSALGDVAPSSTCHDSIYTTHSGTDNVGDSERLSVTTDSSGNITCRFDLTGGCQYSVNTRAWRRIR